MISPLHDIGELLGERSRSQVRLRRLARRDKRGRACRNVENFTHVLHRMLTTALESANRGAPR
jgi:hypothetical protein